MSGGKGSLLTWNLSHCDQGYDDKYDFDPDDDAADSDHDDNDDKDGDY